MHQERRQPVAPNVLQEHTRVPPVHPVVQIVQLATMHQELLQPVAPNVLQEPTRVPLVQPVVQIV